MPSLLSSRHPRGRHQAGGAVAENVVVPPVEQDPPPQVGLVFRDGGEVLLPVHDDRVAALLVVAAEIADGVPVAAPVAGDPPSAAVTVPAIPPEMPQSADPPALADAVAEPPEAPTVAPSGRPGLFGRIRAAWRRIRGTGG